MPRCPFKFLLLYTSKTTFLPNSPIIPQISVTFNTCTPEKPALGSQYLCRFSPLCLENTFTPFHLVIYFRCFRTQLRCLYLKAPLPHFLAFRLTNASPLYYHSPVRFVYCEPNHHINGKINLILLSSFSFLVLSHQQLISFQSSPHSPGPTCTSLLVLIGRAQTIPIWGFCPGCFLCLEFIPQHIHKVSLSLL